MGTSGQKRGCSVFSFSCVERVQYRCRPIGVDGGGLLGVNWTKAL